MYSAAWVNQFETKGNCFKFEINVSRQGSNVNPIQDRLFWGYLHMRQGGGGGWANGLPTLKSVAHILQ